MSTQFPPVRPPLSSTQEKEWRPFTNSASFSTIAPTKAFPGRVIAEIHTKKENNPCSFLDLFKSFANNQTVDRFMKCRVDEFNTPHLEIGSDKSSGASFPVTSAIVTRRYFNDHNASPDSDLEIEANGVKHAYFASRDQLSIHRITLKHSWGGKMYQLISSIGK